MFNKVKKLAMLFTVCSLSLTGCSSKDSNTKDDVSQESKEFSAILVLDKGGVNDESFNQSAWTGAQDAAKKLGVDVKYLETNSDAEYSQNIETAVDLGADLIIGVGFNLSEHIEKAAVSYPEQKFAIIDGSFEEIPSNVTPILFNEEEAGYLAGLVTAKTVDSNKFGFIGGFEVPAVVNYRNGFEKGLLEVNPNAVLLTQYANSFTDAAKGRVIAEQFISEGVSTVLSAAGTVNIGCYEVCVEKGKYAVAVDMAQSYIHPDTILTSAIKKVDVGVSDAIEKCLNGELEGGNSLIYSISNNGVDFEKTKLLSEETINYVETIKSEYK